MGFLTDIILRDTLFLCKGIVVGVAVSAPIGPASIMCIRRTLHRGWWLGIASGLGVAVADTLYGGIVGIGFTSIADYIIEWLTKLRFIGGLFLIVLGIALYLTPAKKEAKHYHAQTFLPAFFSTCGITLANPLLFFLFAAVFAATGLDDFNKDVDLIGFLIFGIFLGSMAWWASLCGALTLLKNRIAVTSLAWTNKISGLLIIIFGIWAMLGTN